MQANVFLVCPRCYIVWSFRSSKFVAWVSCEVVVPVAGVFVCFLWYVLYVLAYYHVVVLYLCLERVFQVCFVSGTCIA